MGFLSTVEARCKKNVPSCFNLFVNRRSKMQKKKCRLASIFLSTVEARCKKKESAVLLQSFCQPPKQDAKKKKVPSCFNLFVNRRSKMQKKRKCRLASIFLSTAEARCKKKESAVLLQSFCQPSKQDAKKKKVPSCFNLFVNRRSKMQKKKVPSCFNLFVTRRSKMQKKKCRLASIFLSTVEARC